MTEGTQIQELTPEDIERMLAEYQEKVLTLGFLSIEAFEDFKYHAVEGMLRFGGSFSTAFGRCLQVADSSNTTKLMRLYFAMCEKYAMLHKMFIAKRDAGVLDEG